MKIKLLIFCFLVTSINVFCQNKFGQVTADGGATYSVWRGFHRIPFKNYNNKFKFTVGTQASVDWAFLRALSFGLGFNTHKHILEIKDYQYTLNNQTIIENPTYVVQANSVHFRALFHFKEIYDDTDEQLDVYFGLSQSYIWWNSRHTSKDPLFPSFNDNLSEIPAIIGGIRYFPLENFGIYAEASIPGTYSLALGVTARFGGRNKFLN